MKGILFKPESIQAIPDGQKTNTRRVEAVLKEINQNPNAYKYLGMNELGEACFELSLGDGTSTIKYIKPRYQVGETVYVKEAWGIDDCGKYVPLTQYVFPDGWPIKRLVYDNIADFSKRSPLFMPKWAARYFITITDVRAERLQEITEADCLAEGIEPCKFKGYTESYRDNDYLIGHFATFWNSINKDYPWENNDWVFVYIFKQEMIRRR